MCKERRKILIKRSTINWGINREASTDFVPEVIEEWLQNDSLRGDCVSRDQYSGDKFR